MWVKKYVKIREMLFKNWKWLFENTNQTPLSILNFEVKCVFYYLKLQINGHIVSYVNEIYIFWLRIFLLVFFPQRIIYIYIYIYIYTHTHIFNAWAGFPSFLAKRNKTKYVFLFLTSFKNNNTVLRVNQML